MSPQKSSSFFLRNILILEIKRKYDFQQCTIFFRILGMHVEKQNLLFKYFSDTLAAIISQAKRSGRYDQVSTLVRYRGLECTLCSVHYDVHIGKPW